MIHLPFFAYSYLDIINTMRKKTFILAATALIVISIGHQFKNSSFTAKSDLSDLALENIEALAIGEWTPNGWVCFSDYIDDTTNSHFVIITRCSDCASVSATAARNSGYCHF